jgi:hypothetical protein
MSITRRWVWDAGLLGLLLLLGAYIVQGWREEGGDPGPAGRPPREGDLLRLIDPKLDAIHGEWTLKEGALVSPGLQWARIRLPYVPPEEYDLRIVAERRQGHDALAVGLSGGGRSFAVWLDGFPNREGLSGLDLLDGILVEDNPASVPGLRLVNGRKSRILVSVRRQGVKVDVDGETVLDWQGGFERLSPSPVWSARDAQAPLFVGADSSQVVFTEIHLTPVTGQGKRLRPAS